jgi:hypothetical protein
MEVINQVIVKKSSQFLGIAETGETVLVVGERWRAVAHNGGERS